MADRPWEADRPLGAERAAAAIGRAFPDVDVRGLAHLGSGWEFDAWLTADGWVFRFPRRAEYATGFDREGRIHGLVAPVLPEGVSVPRVERTGGPGPDFPYAFAGHRLLPGVGADHPAAPVGPVLAKDLGATLGAIHSVPVADALAAGAPAEPDGAADWLQEALDSEPFLRTRVPAVGRALDWLLDAPALPAAPPGTSRFIHNDLSPDHLVVDPGSGRLTGILDWTDAAVGDPALDFMVLWAWRGPRFFEAVLAALGRPVDPGIRERARFLARVSSLVWLRESLEQGTDAAKHVRWVTNAFSPPAQDAGPG